MLWPLAYEVAFVVSVRRVITNDQGLKPGYHILVSDGNVPASTRT